MVFRSFGVLLTDGRMDRLTDERTLVAVESLSRLKNEIHTREFHILKVKLG